MMTTTEIDEALQLIRTLKIAQVRKQLDFDNKPSGPRRYWDDKAVEWVPRSVIVMDFLKSAREQA